MSTAIGTEREHPGELLSSPQSELLHGDNVEAMRTLALRCPSAFRCIYLDPPYNNQESYGHYDDRASHPQWVADMEKVLRLAKPLLSGNGSLWISIDDRQVHYLKVLADTVLGRDMFVSTVVWEHRRTRENRRAFSNNHEYLLVYAKNPVKFRRTRNPLPPNQATIDRHKNPDGDPRGPWQSVSITAQDGHATAAQYYTITAPSGKQHVPPRGRCWAYSRRRFEQLASDGLIWFGRDGTGVPRLKRFLRDGVVGMPPSTLWTAEFAGTTTDAKREVLQATPAHRVFDTPKPLKLITRVLEIATNPGDLVLDPFLGSGTTAVAASALSRPWVGIESSEEAVALSLHRLASAGAPLPIYGRVPCD